MLKSIQGRIVEITLRHDASRIIQYLLQHGNSTQKQLIISELVLKAVEISKTPYGHFAILKAINYCTDASDRKKLLHCMAGHFVAVGTNVIGARTVESVLQLLPSKQTKALKAEFYGRVTSTASRPSFIHLISFIHSFIHSFFSLLSACLFLSFLPSLSFFTSFGSLFTLSFLSRLIFLLAVNLFI